MKLEKLNTILPKMHVTHVGFDYVDVAKHRCIGGDFYVFELAPN